MASSARTVARLASRSATTASRLARVSAPLLRRREAPLPALTCWPARAVATQVEGSSPGQTKQKGKPKLQRGSYKQLDKDDVSFFRSVLGDASVISSLEGEPVAQRSGT